MQRFPSGRADDLDAMADDGRLDASLVACFVGRGPWRGHSDGGHRRRTAGGRLDARQSPRVDHRASWSKTDSAVIPGLSFRSKGS